MIINRHLRSGGQILSVAMPVISQAFITDKEPYSLHSRKGGFVLMVFGHSRSYKCQTQIVAYSRRHGDERENVGRAKTDSEICQTTPLGDFPKGYDHQLLRRNALQEKSTLSFFFRYGKYAIIKMQQRPWLSM